MRHMRIVLWALAALGALSACDTPLGSSVDNVDGGPLQSGLPVNCGNGALSEGEQCDDGNNEAGDGCSAECLVEVENELPCGTHGRRMDELSVSDRFCDEPANRDASISEEPLLLRLRIHVVSDGAPVARAAAISAMVETMNQMFEDTGIQMEWEGEEALDIIDDPRFITIDDNSFNELVVINNDPHALDLYITDQYPGVCGRAYDIGPSPVSDGVVVVNNCMRSNTAAHEIGHILGLWHTFTERAPGDDCDRSFDLCCDTPFDPGTGKCDPTSCEPRCTDGSMPDTSNIMSYFDCAEDPELAHFSPQQNGRMRCYINRNFLYALADDAPPVPPDGPRVWADKERLVRGRDTLFEEGAGFTPNSTANCVARGPREFLIPVQVVADGTFSTTYSPRLDAALGRSEFWCADGVTGVESNRIAYEVVEADECRPFATFEGQDVHITAPAGCEMPINGIYFFDPLPGRPHGSQVVEVTPVNRAIAVRVPEHLAMWRPMTNVGCDVNQEGSCHWLTGPRRDNTMLLSGGLAECNAPTGYGFLALNHEPDYPRCQ